MGRWVEQRIRVPDVVDAERVMLEQVGSLSVEVPCDSIRRAQPQPRVPGRLHGLEDPVIQPAADSVRKTGHPRTGGTT
jgi:hypothetical protein